MSDATADVVFEHVSGGCLIMSGWPNAHLVADLGVSCLKDVPTLFDERTRTWHAPLTDDAFCVVAGDLERAHAAADWSAKWVAHGKRVAVVCREGLNRSGLVAALAIRQLASIDGALALEYVQARRSGSLYNWFFQQALRELPAPPVPA
jgi:hypothetical protein